MSETAPRPVIVGPRQRAADLNAREERRDQVAGMMLARTPYRKMASLLGVALGTIAADVQVIRKRWIANSVHSYDQHVAEQSALLDGIERAMAPKAMLGNERAAEVLLRVMERRARLLGLDRPVRHEVTGADGGPIEVTEALADEADALVDELASRRAILAG